MIEKNKIIYKTSKVVNYYAQSSSKQAPETTIMNLLSDKLNEFKMLDIGVGGGRTTSFFADKVKEYKAIDYSEEMINICRNRFQGKIPPENFLVADARDLNIFGPNRFDFILFSFNGCDYVSAEDREKVFGEIKRILKPGGYFCFSTHNIQSILNWSSISYTFHPYRLLNNIILHFKRKIINNLNDKKFKKIKQLDYVTIKDGAHDWSLEAFYVRPSYQIKHLESLGYKQIKVFNLSYGEELPHTELVNTQDKWLYYLCNSALI
jgi:ubiquinone/menaquinone biosynthesis C-methylase UbiE